MENPNIYEFTATMWLYSGAKASWHFITVPEKESASIKFFAPNVAKRGWGSVPVEVSIGNSTWRTSVFPDKEINCYLLPIKKQVRDAEQIAVDDEVSVTLRAI